MVRENLGMGKGGAQNRNIYNKKNTVLPMVNGHQEGRLRTGKQNNYSGNEKRLRGKIFVIKICLILLRKNTVKENNCKKSEEEKQIWNKNTLEKNLFEVEKKLERFFAEESLGMVNTQNVKKLLGTGEILWGYYI